MTSETTSTTYTTTAPTDVKDAEKAQVGWIVEGKFFSKNSYADEAAVKAVVGADKTVSAAYIATQETTAGTVTTVTENNEAGNGWTVLDGDTSSIPNTRIPTLPSTGSTGTYAFTVIGVAVLGVAAVMVIKGRRKEK